jgi:serine protease AprX
MKKVLAAVAALAVLGALAPAASRAMTGSGTPPARRVSTELEATLASSSTAPLTVFVRGTDREAAVGAVRRAGLALVSVFDSVDVAVASGSPAAVRDVVRQPGVVYVEQNRAISLDADDTADVATRTAEARSPGSPVLRTTTATDTRGNGTGNGGVGQGRGKGNASGTTVTSATPYTGAGESIAIVDSGVDGTHPMFVDPATGTSKVVVNMKLACTNDGPFVLPDTCPTGADEDPFFVDVSAANDSDTPSVGGHGTHVAGIAAGYPVQTSDGRTLMGTAPGAKIVSLSIGQALSIYGADAALDWIVRHHADPCGDGSCPPITVVNNSYGGGTEFDPNSVTTLLQDAVVDAGVVMVWANGNGDATNDGGDGSDNRSSSDAMDPKRGSISVANYDDHETGTRDGTLDPSSSRGAATKPATWPDVSAPGTNITSSCRPYLAVCDGALSPDPNYGTISGTSMATPHVVGIVALLREADPDLTPAQVQDVLENTAHKFQFGAPYWMLTNPKYGNTTSSSSFDKGHGLVDTTAALASVLGRTDAGPAAVCGTNDPGIVDAAVDATSVLGATTPLPNEPALDVLDGSVVWDEAAQTLTLGIHVQDLTDADPPGTTGVVYDFAFSYGGVEYTANAERSSVSGDSAELQTLSPTRTHAAPATVTFDSADDTITIVLDNTKLESVKPFADGDTLSGFTITSRRDEVVVVPDADTANGSCPYTIGGTGGTVTPVPEPQPFPEDPTPPSGGAPDATLTDGQSFTANVTTTAGTGGTPVDGYTCTGPDDPRCFTFRVAVSPGGASSTLNVWLEPGPDQAALEDWDIRVYDAAGSEVGEPIAGVYDPGTGPQTLTETVGTDVTVTAPATYTIVVDPFAVPSGSTMPVHADLIAG